jgi:primosomal protein N' (replication factor Y)
MSDTDIFAGQPATRVKVLFPLPLFAPFDYLAPAGADLAPGAFVRAPLGSREAVGVIWPGANAAHGPASKLKAVSHIFPGPGLAPDVVDFIEWTAQYTMAPAGAVLRMTMRSGEWLIPPKMQKGYRRPDRTADLPGEGAPLRMTPQRAAVLAAAGGGAVSAPALARRAGASEAVAAGLAKAGVLEAVGIDPDPPFDAPDVLKPGSALSAEQAQAAEKLVSRIRAGGHATTLIDGVTGAGKTEVYLEAVAAALGADPSAQILILLPEIALTAPFLARIEDRFAAAPAPWHSDLSPAQRRRVWRRVIEGQARLVVGARSALFLPFKNLRLIVVDEEHDSAYKQEDGVIYHARDLAVARGARGRFPVILASATPSLETVVNVDEGRYQAVGLPSRFADALMPEISLVDMRAAPPSPGRWLSPTLVSAVSETLSAGEQSLLFLNRRGYAPITICRRCGHKMTAPDSDTLLVEHRFENRLMCHHTGFSMAKPAACPACNAEGALTPCGPGVERVAEEAQARWPNAKIAVLSSDTAPSARAMRDILDAMGAGGIDILIATQIAAKGHHFPGLTLVGVVDADLGLAGGDLRAAERTFQLMSQVTGRAGRAEKPGRALLQTYQPGAAVLEALVSGARNRFLAAEAESRRAHGFPPYGRLGALILRSKDEGALRACAAAHRDALPRAEGVTVWGPAPAPIYRLRGYARMRFLVKARRNIHIQRFMGDWLRRVKIKGAVRRVVDIDPYSFL